MSVYKYALPQVYGYWVLQPGPTNGHPHYHMTIFLKEPTDAFSFKMFGEEVKARWRELLGINKGQRANNVRIDENAKPYYLNFTTKNDEKYYNKERLPSHLKKFWAKGRRYGRINSKLCRHNTAKEEHYCIGEDVFEELAAYWCSLVKAKIDESKAKKIAYESLGSYRKRIQAGEDLFMAYLTSEQAKHIKTIVSKGNKVTLDN